MKRKVKVTYEERYRRGVFVDRDEIKARRHANENIPPLTKDAQITDIEMRAAGKCTVDEHEREYIDVRIYVRP